MPIFEDDDEFDEKEFKRQQKNLNDKVFRKEWENLLKDAEFSPLEDFYKQFEVEQSTKISEEDFNGGDCWEFEEDC